jgi:hypothetical protein
VSGDVDPNEQQQRHLALLAEIAPPEEVDWELIAQCVSFRDAVRLCWNLRRLRVSKAVLADMAQLHPPHVTDYLHPDDDPKRRSLPAARIPVFQRVCGNKAITQWLVFQMGDRPMEQPAGARTRAA